MEHGELSVWDGAGFGGYLADWRGDQEGPATAGASEEFMLEGGTEVGEDTSSTGKDKSSMGSKYKAALDRNPIGETDPRMAVKMAPQTIPATRTTPTVKSEAHHLRPPLFLAGLLPPL